MEKEYRALVDERIRRALETGASTCTPEDERGSDLLAAARRQRETRRHIFRRRALSAAAVFTCVFFFFSSLYLKGFFELEETQAGRIPNESANLENGSVVIGGDGNGNMGTWTGQFSAYEDIPDAYRQEMIWFDEIPKGYTVKKIQIQRTRNLQQIKIVLKDHLNHEIKIEEEKDIGTDEQMITPVLNNFTEKKRISDIEVYYKQNGDLQKHVFVIAGIQLKITGSADLEKETEALIASVRIG